jgi:hypothetical protein
MAKAGLPVSSLVPSKKSQIFSSKGLSLDTCPKLNLLASVDLVMENAASPSINPNSQYLVILISSNLDTS